MKENKNQLKATNNFVFIIRDGAEAEKTGIFIPGDGREKPPMGTVFSIGGLVKDGNIRSAKGKRAIFHKGVGFSINFEGADYLVLQDTEIIAIA